MTAEDTKGLVKGLMEEPTENLQGYAAVLLGQLMGEAAEALEAKDAEWRLQEELKDKALARIAELEKLVAAGRAWRADIQEQIAQLTAERDKWCKAAGEWHDSSLRSDKYRAALEAIHLYCDNYDGASDRDPTVKCMRLAYDAMEPAT